MFKLVGKETFHVGNMNTKATINIEAVSGFTYEYTLEINGQSLKKYMENRSKVTSTWLLNLDGIDCRVVLGMLFLFLEMIESFKSFLFCFLVMWVSLLWHRCLVWYTKVFIATIYIPRSSRQVGWSHWTSDLCTLLIHGRCSLLFYGNTRQFLIWILALNFT